MASDEVRRHFDHAAAGYSAFRNAWPLSANRRQELEALATLMHVRSGERVLDAGCGDGELLAWLAARGAEPVGIDISRAMAVESRRRGFRVSVQNLERPGTQPIFDWVLCFGALEFTNSPAGAIAALAACLRSGGRFVLMFPKRNLVGRLYAAYHRFGHGVNVHLFDRQVVATWMRDAGLHAPAWRELALSTLSVAELRPRLESTVADHAAEARPLAPKLEGAAPSAPPTKDA